MPVAWMTPRTPSGSCIFNHYVNQEKQECAPFLLVPLKKECHPPFCLTWGDEGIL